MTSQDEVIFTGAYKDFKLGVNFPLSGKDEQYVSTVLANISAGIEPYAFKFAGIDVKKISDFANPPGKGLASVCSFLEKNTPGSIRQVLEAAVPKPELVSAAESCLINQLFSKAGVQFKVSSESSIKPESESTEDVIAFIGKYKEWVAIKKLSTGGIKDYEVSGILAGINHTIVNKAFDFAGSKCDDALVASATKGKRKSLPNLVACLHELEAKLSGTTGDCCTICKSLETIGYRPYASPEMLTAAYPDIKPPKVKGRKPKG